MTPFLVFVAALWIGGAPPTTPEQQLSRAINLIVTDNDSTEAEKLLLSVIGWRPLTTKAGETARYYLGRYYHRNYYMLKQRDGLDRAVSRYKEIHNRLEDLKAPGQWYAEARFYKSLAYIEQGKWRDAVEAISHLETNLDPEIEIDYLVWSLNRRTINRSFKSEEIKQRYLALLSGRGVTLQTRDGVDRARCDAILADLQSMLGGWKRKY